MLEHDISIGTELEFELPKQLGYNKHNAYRYLIDKATVAGKNTKYRKACSKALDFGKFKYDGTINFGFEYESLPFRASMALNNEKDFKKIFSFFNTNRASVDEHLGMHIHISKKHLSKDDVLKLNYFVFRNTKFCGTIGERKFSKYCRIKENEGEDLTINLKSPNFSGDYRYNDDVHDRYNHKHRMLNVARPKTVEFRFFKSTNNFKTYYKNIEFVIALVNFVKTTKLTVDDFKVGGEAMASIDLVFDEQEIVNSFCHYVQKHRRTYKNLHRFLAERKLIK